jgi:phosphotransferase system HPr (HPr) family protein
MNGDTLQRKMVVRNPNGFHIRPIAAFAELAKKFRSAVTVFKESRVANGKSPLELMTLAAEEGAELLLEISGPDALEALPALVQLLADHAVMATPEPPLPQKG